MSDARKRVLGHTPWELLKAYFDERELDISAMVGVGERKRFPLFLDLCESWQERDRHEVIGDFERIDALARQETDYAMLEAAPDREALLAQESEYARAMWLFMKGEAVFNKAEDIAYAVAYRQSTRKWDSFLVAKERQANSGDKARKALADDISDYHRKKDGSGANVAVEIFPRLSALPDSEGHQLVQATVYVEDLPRADVEFENSQIRRKSRRKVWEAAVVYAPVTGILEVVGLKNDSREALAQYFCNHILECDLSDEEFKIRRFNLNVVKSQSSFGFDPADGIFSVKVAKVGLRTFDESLEMSFTCKSRIPDDSINVVSLMDDKIGPMNPLHNGTSVSFLDLAVVMQGRGKRRRKETIHVQLKPNGCNLNDHDERHRMIMNKYLEKWGLLENVA